jgi:hypothetical protein
MALEVILDVDAIDDARGAKRRPAKNSVNMVAVAKR